MDACHEKTVGVAKEVKQVSKIDFKNLRRLSKSGFSNKMTVSVSAPKSAEGMTLRRCPNASCTPRRFLLGDLSGDASNQDASLSPRREPGTSGCTCPYCGIDADDHDFIDPVDHEYAKGKITAALQRDITNYLSKMAADFNRVQKRNSFIKMEMKLISPPVREPSAYREDLLRNLSCSYCTRKYGIFAVGLFCPDCGSKNLMVHFSRELELVAQQINDAEARSHEGQREYAYRLLGNAHEDVLSAFEMYQKTVFLYILKKRHPDRWEKKRKVGNAFQNAERAEKLFHELGHDPYRVMTDVERNQLNILSRKRHVIGHNLGIVDESYQAHDPNSETGRTLDLYAEDVESFASLCQKIVEELEVLV
ncbi:MAG TPA: hypothetical protein VFO10_02745 [Oligoflexus sp.]|uniref:hypothetical protein n=1 Tax=Oligoflexus sp. TaxID=1971216 RepID=UPI002D7E966B|nr:hypothetical protein [Oligoflexus sp.]HET9236140.1 hypothetical protein [Oligoflexus sp.]